MKSLKRMLKSKVCLFYSTLTIFDYLLFEKHLLRTQFQSKTRQSLRKRKRIKSRLDIRFGKIKGISCILKNWIKITLYLAISESIFKS